MARLHSPIERPHWTARQQERLPSRIDSIFLSRPFGALGGAAIAQFHPSEEQ